MTKCKRGVNFLIEGKTGNIIKHWPLILKGKKKDDSYTFNLIRQNLLDS